MIKLKRPEPMHDVLISKNKVLSYLNDLWYSCSDPEGNKPTLKGETAIEWAIDDIKEMPSAQPERKKGKWINRSLNILYPEFERYTCSVCGKHSYSYDFCPNCGSYNGGEQDE